MKCPKCQFENPADAGFCSKCGGPLRPSDDIPTITHTKTLHPIKELKRGSTLANRYDVIEELGRGGMGRVYRVFDKKIGEEVALKLLNPEIASDRRTIERFRNELRYARKIAHRNVCRMYDLSEEYGAHYITMEYVPGEDLKSMIKMTRQLSAGQVVFIAKQIGKGLAEAHRLGVVHRDLKPKNIIIDREGNARIMDFGIARSTKDKGVTGVGVMIGTPEYMPPEQVEGEEADHRSDIYALGVIMYEMATGRLPFEGDSSLSIALKHKTERPLDPRKFNAQVPEALSRLILKCLEKERERRYQSAGELLSALSEIEERISTSDKPVPKGKKRVSEKIITVFKNRWSLIAALFGVLVLSGIAILYFKVGRPVAVPGEKMLAVLPFNNLGPPEDEYFADGITEEITNRLAALSGLGVISRTSVIQYKNTNKTIRTIGNELGVDYVLEGAVRWNRSAEGRGRVRISPQLIRVIDDTHLWADSYDRILEDIFSIQSEIAEEVARQLDLSILEPERRALNAKPTNNLEAYDYYLRGLESTTRAVSRADSEEHEHGIQLLEKATELDPNFALAYVSISVAHVWAYFTGWDHTEERLTRSRNALDRALELQPNIPQVRQALATYHYRGLLDYDRAAEILGSIQRERPNFNPQLLGYIQRRQGKWEQALETLERAFRLNPRDSALAYELAGASISMRRYKQANIWINRSLSIDPSRLQPQIQKAAIYVLSEGNTQEARGVLETAPEHPLTDYMWFTVGLLERKYDEVLDRLSSLAYDSFEEQHFYFEKNLAYATVFHTMKDQPGMKTHAESARTVLENLIREHPQDPRYHSSLGLAFAYLGKKDEAIQEGIRAAQLYPVSKDAAQGPIYILNLARIYTVVGEYEKAIEQLEYMLFNPTAEYLWHLVTISVLRLDPQWDPLRVHLRFKRLLQGN